MAVGQTPVAAKPPAAQAATQTAAQTAAKPADDPLPAGPGKDLVSDACTQCHTLDRIVRQHMDKAGWQGTVDDMISRGLDLSDADEATIVSYLTQSFGPQKPGTAASVGSAPAAAGAAGAAGGAKPAADPLPAGPGKDLVADACTQCHTLDRIVRQHMDKAGWQGTVDDMISRGLELSDADEATIVSYLVAHFGKQPSH